MSIDRRSGRERRRSLGRRETADGHVRHAIQMVRDVIELAELGNGVRTSLVGAVRRLWLALHEIDATEEARRQLGKRVRRVERSERPDS